MEDESSDEGDKFFDVTAMSMMRESAETPITVQRKRV